MPVSSSVFKMLADYVERIGKNTEDEYLRLQRHYAQLSLYTYDKYWPVTLCRHTNWLGSERDSSKWVENCDKRHFDLENKMCASRPVTRVKNGYTNKLNETFTCTKWDEVCTFTRFVELGVYSVDKVGDITDVDHEADDKHSDDMKSEDVSVVDDEGSIGDLFDVYINPAAYSDSEENDDLFVDDCTVSAHDEHDIEAAKPTRKSSLRDPNQLRTPPGTPSKKSVRFADALGLDLETVRHILETDSCPSPPMSDLFISGMDATYKPKLSTTVLRMCFEQPGGRADFLARLYQQNICLENIVVSNLTVLGTIKVRNLSYQKEVRIRYTWDNWRSHANILAMYVQGSCDGPTDRFSFGFHAPRNAGVGDKIMFAVFFRVAGQEYWDNNHGNNYTFLIEEMLLNS